MEYAKGKAPAKPHSKKKNWKKKRQFDTDETYERYINSQEWKVFRKRVLAERGHKCEKCGSGALLQVHHLHYRSFRHEASGDVQVLCEDCHSKIHGNMGPRERFVHWFARSLKWEQYGNSESLPAKPVKDGAPPSAKSNVQKPGDPCHLCGHPVEERHHEQPSRPIRSRYFYVRYLACPHGCGTVYFFEPDKRWYEHEPEVSLFA